MVISVRVARAPLTDAVITALSRLVDDSQSETREPSHSDLEFQFKRCEIATGDPKAQGQTVGKAKRVRATLSWALEHHYEAGENAVATLIALVRGCGGFRPSSPNFAGAEVIRDLADAFRIDGYELSQEGDLHPFILENLSGPQLTAALQAYVKRAKRGVEDAALVTGTGKDLLEATAAHILVERYGTYSQQSNFPTLLGQTYAALNLPTSREPADPDESAQRKLARALFDAGCSVSLLRNKQGTGHGRPWLPSVTAHEARTAVEVMGIVAEFLLATHHIQP